ncbi:MAG: pilus (MSHA type) biogenesis protein MshL [Burkholderiales bacterium]
MKERTMRGMRHVMAAVVVLVIGGCASPDRARDVTYDSITRELDKAVKNRVKPATPDVVTEALLPPLVIEMPKAEGRSADTRFDLNVNNAPANQVFMAVVSGTRYSMIVHPDVKEPISVNLKDVTVFEALDTIRDLYGYEYRVQGTRITVQPVKLQTRVFQVNYLQATRRGSTDVRVTSGSITAAAPGVSGIPGTTATAAAPGAPTGGTVSRTSESSRVTTASDSDFWGDVTKSLNAIVGSSDGRSVIVNPQSGVIVVRAMPTELRNVESFLKAMQLVVERQVVLEAKLIQVTLSDSSQTGINWAAFPDGGRRGALGVVTKEAQIGTGGELASSALAATLGAGGALAGKAAGGVFGLALQTGNFAALMSFLETQGTINVLSSPRIATINNQKAVLKVGTDEFFVTNISTTAVTSGAGTTTTPSITVQPFFSGIALDVTPQIDDSDNIILHIHPSVSSVSEKQKVVNLGAAGSFTLPLASSEINETDTIVRVQDGNIVAIGGLMKQQTSSDRSQPPGMGDASGWGGLFRQRANSSLKSELVILLKPTIIRSDRDWEQGLAEARDRIRTMERQ